MKTLILGGVRSGKSRLAERLAVESGGPVTYLATAQPGSREMAARIEAHRARRPDNWTVIEAPLYLTEALNRQRQGSGCLVIECMTMWLTNLLGHADADLLEREYRSFLDTLPGLSGEVLIVSNETNMGVIPLGELSRRYCDVAGTLHQELASLCDRVILTVAGLPHVLKGNPL
ncbi:bifunctional adenosylcobinamide kinase/adenosylcobinamide-phosphate guanylyltransferase [Gammaproteobacteria bacterium]|nr:bifunctional adenosylcobinamide kinase/adenosylcobinamide-phosphate guanylyltransferase [Gammaproteobacteria bacterium]